MKRIIGFILVIIVSYNLSAQTTDSTKTFIDKYSFGAFYSGWYIDNDFNGNLSSKFAVSFYRILGEKISVGLIGSYGWYNLKTEAGHPIEGNLFEIMPSFKYTIPSAKTDKTIRLGAIFNIGYIGIINDGIDNSGLKLELAPVITLGSSNEIGIEFTPSWNFIFSDSPMTNYFSLNVGIVF